MCMHSTGLDADDLAVVSVLSENTRLSIKRMAARLGVSEATVRRKLKKLLDADVVSMGVHTDPVRLGLGAQALVGLSVRIDRLSNVVQALQACDNVPFVAVVSGRFDIVFQGVFGSVEDISRFLATEIGTRDDVERTETMLCLRVEKGKHLSLGSSTEQRATPTAASKKRKTLEVGAGRRRKNLHSL